MCDVEQAKRGEEVELDEILKGLLANCPELAKARREGWNVLHCAAFAGQEKAVAQILAVAPSLINQIARAEEDGTALHLAAKNGHENVMNLLLEACPTLIDSVTDDGLTVLHSAVCHPLVVARLLAAKPTLIDAVTCDGWTVLHSAACNGNESVVKQLLAASKTLINAVTSDGMTALHWAIQYRHETVAAQLLAESPKLIEAVSKDGRTALHLAAFIGADTVIELLLAAGPGLMEAVDKHGATPLRLAANGGHDKVVTQFLRTASPSLINTADNEGWTAVLCAAMHGHTKVVRQLLDASPTAINAVLSDGKTALHLAATFGRDDIVKYLLTVVPEDMIGALDHFGQSALHCAVPSRRKVVARALLARKPDLISLKWNGKTILHLALQECLDKEFVEEVFRLDPQAARAEDREHKTPLYFALLYRNEAAIELLQWHFSLDELAKECERQPHKGESTSVERFRPVLESQCREALDSLLLPEVVATVLEFLGSQRANKRLKRN